MESLVAVNRRAKQISVTLSNGNIQPVNDMENVFIGNNALTTTVVESTMKCANIIHIVNSAFCSTLNRMIRIIHSLNQNSCTLGIHLFDTFYFFSTWKLTHKIPPHIEIPPISRLSSSSISAVSVVSVISASICQLSEEFQKLT